MTTESQVCIGSYLGSYLSHMYILRPRKVPPSPGFSVKVVVNAPNPSSPSSVEYLGQFCGTSLSCDFSNCEVGIMMIHACRLASSLKSEYVSEATF